MPVLSSMEPGDVPYPQYSITTTMPMADTIQTEKGHLYTTTAVGYLTPISSTVERGFFQAKSTSNEIGSGGLHSVQVLCPGSRMIFVAKDAALTVGDEVLIDSATSKVFVGNKSSILHIGRVFEIYTRNSDGTKNFQTLIPDEKVIVETFGA